PLKTGGITVASVPKRVKRLAMARHYSMPVSVQSVRQDEAGETREQSPTDATRHILHRYRKPDALRAQQHCGVDSDDFTDLGNQGPAAVAGVDRRVGLQVAAIAFLSVAGEDACGDGIGQAGGAADGV